MFDLIDKGKLREGELDESELRSLLTFSDSEAAEILALFRDGNFNIGVGSKSGYLAGIMRRYRKQSKPQVTATENTTALAILRHDAEHTAGDFDNDQQMNDSGSEDATGLDEMIDEVEKLTGCPLPQDTLLYALPMCGPYSAFNNFKYKVKLTPDTQKKGKAAKQALEVFLRSRDLSQVEKVHMKSLTDPEMVAIMIGDVKLSTPGLHSLQKAKKVQKKGQGAR